VKDRHTKAIPFDNTPVHCYEYDHRTDPWCTEQEIPRLADHIRSAGEHEQNELWKFAGIQVTAQQSDAGNPEEAKLDLLLAESAAYERMCNEIRIGEFPHKMATVGCAPLQKPSTRSFNPQTSR